MKDSSYNLLGIYLLVALSLVGWGISSLCERCSSSTSGVDTVNVKIDSVRDTVYIHKVDTLPVVKNTEIIKYVPIKEVDTSLDCSEPAEQADSMLLIVQKEYSDDSTYTAYVSGIKYSNYPKLDSIDVKSKLITNTIEKTITVKEKKSRWGVSVTAGPTYDVINGKMGAGISVGLSYTIFNF